MKSITEYQDYRLYMRDFYEERKRTSAFSWRKFSKLAGFASPSYLKLVCEGKSALSRVGLPRVASAMDLVSYELVYFEKMVEYGNAKTDVKKKFYFEELAKVARELRARVVDADAFEYYGSAVNTIVRELVPLMPGAMPSEIAKKIKHGFTAQQVRDSILLLLRFKLLRQVGQNAYAQTDRIITGSTDAIPLALRSLNREMIDMAREAVDMVDPRERNISGLTMGVDAKTFARITEEVDNCRKRVMAIANECENIDQVYRLNLQFFPLTEKI